MWTKEYLKEYLNECSKIHNFKYKYTKISQVNSAKDQVTIICNQHGEFIQKLYHHKEGHGCKECQKETLRKLKAFSLENFQKQLDQKFGPIYQILTPYINNHTKIKCKCLKCNQIFERIPSTIINGVGCTNCFSSKLEQSIAKILNESKIQFTREKIFPWLPKKRFDFYLPEYNVCIECHGEQHFIPKNFFGGVLGLEKIQSNDLLKYNACKNHKIDIFYFAEKQHSYFSNVFTSTEELLQAIKNYNT